MVNAEPKGSLSLFPDLWMSPKKKKLWDLFSAKENIKAERVDGMSEEERLAYRLGVDEGLWFVAVPMLESASTKNESLEALEAAVEKLDGSGAEDNRGNTTYKILPGKGPWIRRSDVLKLIAERTAQKEPKEMRAE